LGIYQVILKLFKN